jgi:hypothetical protein
MSIHSVDDYDPSSTTPVFGGAVSQTKLQQQQQPINDLGGADKLATPPLVVNGQNETTNNKNSDNLGNGTTESVNGKTATDDSTNVHVNGQSKKTTVDAIPPINATTKDNVNPAEESISASGAPDPVEKASQNDPLPESSNEPTVNAAAPSTTDTTATIESKSALSTSTDVVKEDVSQANVDNAPPPAEVKASNDNVPASATAPEATVVAESHTPEPKSKVNIFYSNHFVVLISSSIVSSW